METRAIAVFILNPLYSTHCLVHNCEQLSFKKKKRTFGLGNVQQSQNVCFGIMSSPISIAQSRDKLLLQLI